MNAHLKYLSYVVRHKWFVFLAGLRVGGIPLWRLLIHDWSKFTPAEWRPYVQSFYTNPRIGETVSGVANNAPFKGVVLDVRPDRGQPGEVACLVECDSQPRPFWAWPYEIVRRIEVDAAFDRAWLHHQHANPHHWQHWLLRMDDGPTVAIEMPEHFAREMVADWMGAGRAITGRWEVAEWYAKNRERIELHSQTRTLVDGLVAPREEER